MEFENFILEMIRIEEMECSNNTEYYPEDDAVEFECCDDDCMGTSNPMREITVLEGVTL